MAGIVGVRAQMSLWVIAVLVSISVLAGSLWWLMRPHATVSALTVTDSYTDEQARQAAESTALAWFDARNERNVPNMMALMCTGSARKVAVPYTSENPVPDIDRVDTVSTGLFERDGGEWRLSVFYRSNGLGYGGEVFTFGIQHGELRICNQAAPRSG